VLTREILAQGPTNAALLAYEAERRPATTDLVLLNRRNGPEQVMQLVAERAPDAATRHRRIVAEGTGDITANYKRRQLPGRGPQRQAADRDDAGRGDPGRRGARRFHRQPPRGARA
jgi:hypothetical protein